uniref:CSON014837 protein n=1 Tax=Culicoides sonorensis TaxID=179676 RepID=A0A336KV67_CULSO
MMVRKKVTLIICCFIAFISVVSAVKPPGYVQPPKIEDKNPAKYAYNYAVTGDDKGTQGHEEVRNGINTTGNYFVKTGDAQSDVSYFSDDWGFHPVSRYETKSANSHVTSHFALGKEAVDALNENKDGRFSIPQENAKSGPIQSGPLQSSLPVLPTKLPVFNVPQPQKTQFIQFTPAPQQIQFVTPSKPQESELNRPLNPRPSQPPQNLVYNIFQQQQPQEQIQFVPVQQFKEQERPFPSNGHQPNPTNFVFLKPDIEYAPQNQPKNQFVSVNINHGPIQQKQQQIPILKNEQPQQQIFTFVSSTPKYVTNEDVLNINAAIQPQPQPQRQPKRPNPNEHEKSPGPNQSPQEPRDKQLNSIAFQHPIVVEDIEFKPQEQVVSTTQVSREYLPPLPDKKVNIDLIKIDHNQGQFLKETTASLDIAHQSLEGNQDQHFTDSTSAPQKEAPSRYFLKQFKNRPKIVLTTTVKYPKSETLVITQRPISNKFLAPVQAGLKLANDDCNDEEEHKKHTVTKTVVEVQKSVNVIVDDRKPQYGTRYVQRNRCSNGNGKGCDTKVIIQPHIIKEQVPVHIETQKIIEKPVPYPVNHIIEKQVPVYKETVKEVKVPVYVPQPYPVKEVQQVNVPVEKTIIKEVPKIQQVIKEVPVDRPVYVDRHVVHEKFIDRPVIQEKTVVKETSVIDVPVVKEVEKIVHVDRPVIQEKIVEKPYPVDRPVYIDRPVEKTVYKDKIIDRPYPVVQEKVVHVDRPVEKIVHVDRPYPVEKIVEKQVPVEKVVHVDRPYPVVQEKIVHVDRPVEKIVHVDRPYPVEKVVEKEVPVEKIVHVDRPYPVVQEKIVHVDRPYPVEKIVEKEVPVEKIVHVDRPYPVVQEKIVEKIVHVDRPVEKIVHVDRPVEKIVHVDRPYPVEKIVEKEVPVEKIVHVDRPYPVVQEKIIHVDRPYPVEKIVEKEVEKIVHVDRPYPVEKIVEKEVPVEKIVHVDRPYPVQVEVKVPVYIPQPYPQPYPVHVEKKVPYPVHQKAVYPVYHEKHTHLKTIQKPIIKTNPFAQHHKIKHVFIDYPMPPQHSHYAYPLINHHSTPIKIEKHISVEKPKFTGYHYEKPSVQLNVDNLFAEKPKAVYADKFYHSQPCIHSTHQVKDDYIGPTPFTSDYWATGTRDGITVKRHIENGRSLRIESGGFLPPLEPSTPIDANGVPLQNEGTHSKK